MKLNRLTPMLPVRSMPASVEFYQKFLGFEVENRMDINAIPARVAMLRRDELRIELFEVPNAATLPPGRRQPNTDPHTHGNKHVAFAVPHVDTFVKELQEKGADIALVGHMEFGSFVFVRDNAGNLIEFVQQPDMWS